LINSQLLKPSVAVEVGRFAIQSNLLPQRS
jgi:hypothetical protein